MHVCVVSSKECWQDATGNWMTYGSFPVQIGAIASLFDTMTMVIVRGQAHDRGLPLPSRARIVPLDRPEGDAIQRKISLMKHLRYYLNTIAPNVRQADVVYTPLPADISLLGMLLALVLRKRLIAWYGGSWVTNSQTTLMNRVTRAGMRAFAGGRNVMMALGPASLATVPATNMHWIFDATVLSPNSVTTLGPDFDRTVHTPLRLAYVGRLSPVKGVSYLVEALGLLRNAEHQDYELPQLIIIGDGPERELLKKLVIKHRCEDLVLFTGQLSYTDLIGQLLQTDVCVLPSLSEGFCKARLDAMLCGVPVITTEAGFGREIVGPDGERGWVVPAGNSSALAAALQRVLTEPIDWPRLRQRCRDFAEQHTLESWARKMGQICAQQWKISLVEGKLTA